jgi:hypothetical protein
LVTITEVLPSVVRRTASNSTAEPSAAAATAAIAPSNQIIDPSSEIRCLTRISIPT